MHTTQMQAFSDELLKIAEASARAKLFAYFDMPLEKEAAHVESQITLRAPTGTYAAAMKHADQVRDGLGHINHHNPEIVTNHFNQGDTFHVTLVGGLKGIVERIGDELVMKTALEPAHTSTSRGELMPFLKRVMGAASPAGRR